MFRVERGRSAVAILIASGMIFFPLTAKAAEDLSSFGVPVETAKPINPAVSNEPTKKRWPAHVCAEILRVENIVISGPLRPTDRGLARGGLLLLEQLHCGIDVSKKFAADQNILDDEQRKAQRDYEEAMDAAQRIVAQPREPIVVQVPQVPAASSLPDPSFPLNCLTTRLGGGISTTTCR